MRDRIELRGLWRRRRDKRVGRVVQRHNRDRTVEIRLEGEGSLIEVSYGDLRTKWVQL